MTIESFEGKLEPAYINLRFKTLKEKQEQIPIDTGNSIKNFLESECTFSRLYLSPKNEFACGVF